MASLKSLQKRYQRSLESGEFYAAEQACRMMHHRLTQGNDVSPQQLQEARSVLFDGATALIKQNQPQAAASLGFLAVKHCVQYKVPVTEENVASFRAITGLFNPSGDSSQEVLREKLRFLNAVLAWSSRQDCHGFQHGHPGVNADAAHCAAEAAEFDLAQRLFIRSDDPEGCGTFLYTFAVQETPAREHALVLLRSVARYLVSDNVKDAVIVRKTFAELAGWCSMEGRRRSTRVPPLANFCELLIKLCQLEKAAAPLFHKVCIVYQADYGRDEHVKSLVTQIGTKYFGIAPPQVAGMAGMMNSMLRGFMGS